MALKRRTLVLNPATGGVRVLEQSKRPVTRTTWFDRVFRLEVFDGGGRCVFLKRWTLLSVCGWDVYLHHWINDDWTEHLHDHSRHMLSIGLWGGYAEMLSGGATWWSAPWVRFFRAEHRHRVIVAGKTCWTLIVAWPQSRGSFFYVGGERMNPTTYLRSPHAEAQKRC